MNTSVLCMNAVVTGMESVRDDGKYHYEHRLLVVMFGQWLCFSETSQRQAVDSDRRADDCLVACTRRRGWRRLDSNSKHAQWKKQSIAIRYHELWRGRWALLQWRRTLRQSLRYATYFAASRRHQADKYAAHRLSERARVFLCNMVSTLRRRALRRRQLCEGYLAVAAREVMKSLVQWKDKHAAQKQVLLANRVVIERCRRRLRLHQWTQLLLRREHSHLRLHTGEQHRLIALQKLCFAQLRTYIIRKYRRQVELKVRYSLSLSLSRSLSLSH
jgi:hypothetical protein